MTEKGNCEPTKRPYLTEMSDRFNQNLLECEELLGVIEIMFLRLNGYNRPKDKETISTSIEVMEYSFTTDMNQKIDKLNNIRVRMNELAINLRNLVGQ
jgi:hypothetical protein